MLGQEDLHGAASLPQADIGAMRVVRDEHAVTGPVLALPHVSHANVQCAHATLELLFDR